MKKLIFILIIIITLPLLSTIYVDKGIKDYFDMAKQVDREYIDLINNSNYDIWIIDGSNKMNDDFLGAFIIKDHNTGIVLININHFKNYYKFINKGIRIDKTYIKLNSALKNVLRYKDCNLNQMIIINICHELSHVRESVTNINIWNRNLRALVLLEIPNKVKSNKEFNEMIKITKELNREEALVAYPYSIEIEKKIKALDK